MKYKKYNGKKHNAASAGFTLIELMMVLLIVGFITATVFMSDDVNRSQQQTALVKGNVGVVRTSLVNYADANGSLPCPGSLTEEFGSDLYGKPADPVTVERCDQGVTVSATIVNTDHDVFCGSVPWRALGIDISKTLNDMGDKIIYCVTGYATNPCYWATEQGALGVPQESNLVVKDPSGTALTTNVVAVLYSTGENRHGAYPATGNRLNKSVTNTKELDNCMCTSSAASDPEQVRTFHYRVPNMSTAGNATTKFDDIVEPMSINEFVGPGDVTMP